MKGGAAGSFSFLFKVVLPFGAKRPHQPLPSGETEKGPLLMMRIYGVHLKLKFIIPLAVFVCGKLLCLFFSFFRGLYYLKGRVTLLCK